MFVVLVRSSPTGRGSVNSVTRLVGRSSRYSERRACRQAGFLTSHVAAGMLIGKTRSCLASSNGIAAS